MAVIFMFDVVPPSAPILLTTSVTSSRSLSLSWTASVDDGGSPVTGYVVEYRNLSATPSPAFLLSISVAPNVFDLELTGLAPFTDYQVRVRGENVAGVGLPSNTQQARTRPEGEVNINNLSSNEL